MNSFGEAIGNSAIGLKQRRKVIPYIETSPIVIWRSITIHPFGLLVVTGCIIGYLVARWHAGTRGLDGRLSTELAICILVPAFILAHVVTLVLYFPDTLPRSAWIPTDMGKGMSSYGGFLGGSLGAVLYLKWRKLPVLEYIDAMMLGLTVGWFFGRLGCTIVHDHPGLRSQFFLAVLYPDGPRHDLGFYEWLLTIILIIIGFSIRGRSLPAGALTGVISIAYAPVRFMLDFLRTGDKAYWGFTPGQYFSVILFSVGIWVLGGAYKRWAVHQKS